MVLLELTHCTDWMELAKGSTWSIMLRWRRSRLRCEKYGSKKGARLIQRSSPLFMVKSFMLPHIEQ